MCFIYPSLIPSRLGMESLSFSPFPFVRAVLLVPLSNSNHLSRVPIKNKKSVTCVWLQWGSVGTPAAGTCWLFGHLSSQCQPIVKRVLWFLCVIAEHEWRWHVEHGCRLWRWRSLRTGGSSLIWWQRVVPVDDPIAHARLPQCSLHLRERLAAPIPFGTLGQIYRRLPAALVRHSNRTRPRLLVGTVRLGHGSMLSRHVPTGHFDGHHHPPASIRRSGQSLGTASQIGTLLLS